MILELGFGSTLGDGRLVPKLKGRLSQINSPMLLV
jgi:hypothetical protein